MKIITFLIFTIFSGTSVFGQHTTFYVDPNFELKPTIGDDVSQNDSATILSLADRYALSVPMHIQEQIKNYDWRADINRTESIRDRVFRQTYQTDRYGRNIELSITDKLQTEVLLKNSGF